MKLECCCQGAKMGTCDHTIEMVFPLGIEGVVGLRVSGTKPERTSRATVWLDKEQALKLGKELERQACFPHEEAKTVTSDD